VNGFGSGAELLDEVAEVDQLGNRCMDRCLMFARSLA
jgi:hypothetical protein